MSEVATVPRDGKARGPRAIEHEELAWRLVEASEAAIATAYHDGFMDGYLARAEDEREQKEVPSQT